MRAPSASTGEKSALSRRRGRRRSRRPRRRLRYVGRRDTALAQPVERAADLAAQRAARSRFHRGEHCRRLRARDRAERARYRSGTNPGRGTQLAQARERLGGWRGRVEARCAEACVLVLDVGVSHCL